MIQDVAVITTLFDYPEDWEPPFYQNALKHFDKIDIKILRYNNLIKTESYYEKLYTYKVIELFKYIQEHVSGKYKYILYLDATDTNFVGDPNRIIEHFSTLNKSILFCAEKGLWPPTDFNHLYEQKEKKSDSRYLNSGLYFGYTEKIKEYLEKIIKDKLCIDDQGAWAIEYLRNDDIEIDQNCNVFFSTLNNKQFVDINDGGVSFVGISPIIIHDNGPHNEETLKLTNLLKK
jgi:hypothetical protein